MPNWIEGTMKLRGKRGDIKRFLDGELGVSSWRGEVSKKEDQIIDESGDGYIEYTFKDKPHILGTRRAFVTDDYLYMGDDEGVVCLKIKQAWSFDASGDRELEVWGEKAEKYNLDIKLYGIERGVCFCQEVIVLHEKKQIINNVIQYEDWDWECPFPNMGG